MGSTHVVFPNHVSYADCLLLAACPVASAVGCARCHGLRFGAWIGLSWLWCPVAFSTHQRCARCWRMLPFRALLLTVQDGPAGLWVGVIAPSWTALLGWIVAGVVVVLHYGRILEPKAAKYL